MCISDCQTHVKHNGIVALWCHCIMPFFYGFDKSLLKIYVICVGDGYQVMVRI